MNKINFSYQKNCRDLGGMETKSGQIIKYGRLYRTGKLTRVSASDISLIKELGITDIIDLRSEEEFKEKQDYPFEGVNIVNFPALDNDMGGQNTGLSKKEQYFNFLKLSDKSVDYMRDIYYKLAFFPQSIEAFSNFFKLISEKEDGVFMWHCSQGKDRAGVLSYILELALGVDSSTARSDYLASEEAMILQREKMYKQVNNTSEFSSFKIAIDNMFSVKEIYLDTFIESVIEHHASFDNYFQNVLHIDLEKLKRLYLTNL